MAAYYGHLDTFKYLIDTHHCDLFVRDQDNDTPFDLAVTNKAYNITRFLIMDVGIFTDRRVTKQMKSRVASHGDLEIIKYLRANFDFDPLHKNEERQTRLHLASSSGELQFVKYFLEELKTDINLPGGRNNYTPLHFACLNGQLEVVRYIVGNHNCNLNIQARNKVTPLHLACGAGHLHVVQYLTTVRHCDVSVRDSWDDTPAHDAAGNGKLEILKYLLEDLHTNPHTLGQKKSNLVQRALDSGHHDILSYMVSTYKLEPPSDRQYQQARSRPTTGSGHEYVTWQAKIGLGRESVADLVQKGIRRVKNLIT